MSAQVGPQGTPDEQDAISAQVPAAGPAQQRSTVGTAPEAGAYRQRGSGQPTIYEGIPGLGPERRQCDEVPMLPCAETAGIEGTAVVSEEEVRPGRPARTVTVVTVEEIIKRAKARLDLPKPKIGSAPCTDAECEGTVGVPTWFWLENDQWKTQTDSATAGRKSVTIKAKPSKVTWSLGDGQSVSCSGPGTPFDTSKGYSASPDCGIEQGYQSAGRYTLTSTITYAISITGATEETETFTRSSSERVTIGEAQAIVGQSGS